jgi:hypothetical protein
MNHSKALVGNCGENEIMICLHSSLGSAKQWSVLMAQLGGSCGFNLTEQFSSECSEAALAKQQPRLEVDVKGIVDFIK